MPRSVSVVRRLTALVLMGGFALGPVLAAVAGPVRVLTYGSMTGKGSLGAFVEKEFASSCKGCSVKFVTTGESAGLFGRLQADHRRDRARAYDVVLGLGEHHYRAALAEKWVAEGRVFNRSPFALMVDVERFPVKEWPTSWKDLPSKLKGRLLVQDPRLSESGLGWLRAIYEMKALEPKVAQSLVERSFTSWSASYEAFLSGKGLAVWSYRSSEAYHRCQEKTDRYRVLPLKEGYPEQKEWVAPIAGAKVPAGVARFVEFMGSPVVQERIPTLNLMYPADESVKLPPCYAAVTLTAGWEPEGVPTLKDIRRWIDEWSL